MDVTKRMSITQILSEGFLLFKNNWKTLFAVGAPYYGLMAVLLSAFYLYSMGVSPPNWNFDFENSLIKTNIWSYYLGVAAISLISVLFSNIAVILTMLFAKDKLDGKDVPWQTHYADVQTLFLPVIGTALLLGVLLTVGYIALIIPCLIGLVYWFFTIQSVIFKQKSGWSAMKESYNIIKNRWWLSFAYILSIGFILGIPLNLIMGIIMVIGFLLYLVLHSALPGILIGVVAYTIVLIFISVLTNMCYTVWYLNWDANRIVKK